LKGNKEGKEEVEEEEEGGKVFLCERCFIKNSELNLN